MNKWVLAVSTVVAFSGSAHAEFTKGSQTIAVIGGFSGSGSTYDYEPGHSQPVTGGGGAFGAQYMYYLKDSPAIAIGADILSSPNGDRSDDDLLAGYDTTQRLKSVAGLVVARLSFPRGFFRPFIFGGMGAHSSSQKLMARPRSGSWPGGGNEVRALIDEDATSFALGAGVGFDLFFTESLFLGSEIRGTWLAGLNTEDNAALRSAGFTSDSDDGITQGNILLRLGLKF